MTSKVKWEDETGMCTAVVNTMSARTTSYRHPLTNLKTNLTHKYIQVHFWECDPAEHFRLPTYDFLSLFNHKAFCCKRSTTEQGGECGFLWLHSPWIRLSSAPQTVYFFHSAISIIISISASVISSHIPRPASTMTPVQILVSSVPKPHPYCPHHHRVFGSFLPFHLFSVDWWFWHGSATVSPSESWPLKEAHSDRDQTCQRVQRNITEFSQQEVPIFIYWAEVLVHSQYPNQLYSSVKSVDNIEREEYTDECMVWYRTIWAFPILCVGLHQGIK